jgi:hypothetical protein
MKRPTPNPRRNTTAPRRSPVPTPRPRNAQAIMAGQRGNRNAERIAREQRALRRP